MSIQFIMGIIILVIIPACILSKILVRLIPEPVDHSVQDGENAFTDSPDSLHPSDDQLKFH